MWHKYIRLRVILILFKFMSRHWFDERIQKFLFGRWTSFPFSPFPSISRCLTHSFSGDVSTETESMHRWRQKFLADNQSSSFPECSEEFVTFYSTKWFDLTNLVCFDLSMRTSILFHPDFFRELLAVRTMQEPVVQEFGRWGTAPS